MKTIVSPDNARFKALKNLLENGRARRKTGQIFLEGWHLVQSYVRCLGAPLELCLSEKGLQNPEITSFLASSNLLEHALLLSGPLFDRLTTLETPDGIMAVARRPEPQNNPDKTQDAVLLDGLQDPGNLGSIFRSAAAAGFVQILLSADCAHAWSPKTLRAGAGAHFQLEIHEHQDLSLFAQTYQEDLILTAPKAALDLYSMNLKKPLAWVFGNEGQGVRPDLLKNVRKHVNIPMANTTESLNVAAAAAVCLFETFRQRTLAGGDLKANAHNQAEPRP